MSYKNSKDQKKYRKKWHKENYHKYAVKHYAKVKERRATLEKWLKGYKSRLQCELCGENEPCCLAFHHIDSNEKEIEVSKAPNRGWSIERMLEEIKKCQVLCFNCHRKLHAGVV